MSTFILVHGSWHGAWCWDRAVPLLEAAGHRAIAVDLPGHGADHTPHYLRTFDAYVQRVIDVIEAQAVRPVLVGHSMGGTVITACAEARSDRISHLIYVAGYLPTNGQSLLDLAQTDTETMILPALVIEDGLHWIRDDAVDAALYADCSELDRAFARARLVKEPITVVSIPVHTTEARFGAVPRTYIETTGDKALGLGLQRRMQAATPCRVLSVATGHSPFFAAPAALVDRLIQAS